MGYTQAISPEPSITFAAFLRAEGRVMEWSTETGREQARKLTAHKPQISFTCLLWMPAGWRLRRYGPSLTVATLHQIVQK